MVIRQLSLHPLLCVVLALSALALLPDSAFANGWLGFRNDTQQVLVVQDITNAAGRKGKSQRLYPGECILDAQNAAGNRCIVIVDVRCPDRPLYQGTILYKGEDLFFSIQSDPMAPAPTGVPANCGRLRLVPTRLPANPQPTR